MQSKRPGTTEQETGLVADAVEEMTDEVRIEDLAAEYARKRKATLENEKRILRFIKVKLAEWTERADEG